MSTTTSSDTESSNGRNMAGVIPQKRKNSNDNPPKPKRTIEDDDTEDEEEEKEEEEEEREEPLFNKKEERKHGKESMTAMASPDNESSLQRIMEENERLRKKLRKMEEGGSKRGGDLQLNIIQKNQLATFVKETLFRKVKFVNQKNLQNSGTIMQKCFASMGLSQEDAHKYSSEIRKQVKYYLTQRRNYVIQRLKVEVTGK